MNKEELFKKPENKKSSDDILLAILINILGSNDFATYNPIAIHQILYSFKSKNKGYERLLKAFTFNTSSIISTSDEIVNVFSRLGIANILNLTSPTFDRFAIKNKKNLKKRIKRKLSRKEFEMTKEIAEAIKKNN